MSTKPGNATVPSRENAHYSRRSVTRKTVPRKKSMATDENYADLSTKSRTPFSSEVRHILDSFMETHASYPYATKEEKRQLMFATRLNEHQITQYLSNYRRRHMTSGEKKKFKRSLYLKNSLSRK